MKNLKISKISVAIIFLIVFLVNLKCLAQEKSKNNISVSITAGLTQSKIRSYTAPGVTEYNLPDETQKFSIGSYLGAKINYRVKTKLFITTGFDVMVNKIKYTISEGQIQQPDSQWINTNGKMQFNTTTFFIPLQISYHFKENTNTPFVTVGTALNLYMGTKEKYSILNDADGNEVSSGTLKYRSKDYNGKNLCLSLGGGYLYKLTDKLGLKVHGMYNFSTAKVFKKELQINVNHRINFFQLGFALNYIL
jgi:hypothetical protein